MILQSAMDCGLQDIGESMVSLLGCAGFFKMIVSLDEFKGTLTDFIHGLLRAVHAAHTLTAKLKERDTADLVSPEVYDAFTEGLERVTKLARFIGTLLNLYPEELHQALGAQDILYIVHYKGKLFPEKSFQDLMLTNQNLGQMCDEIIRTASTTMKYGPEKDRQIESVTGMIDRSIPVTSTRLEALLSVLPDLQKGIRKVEMKPLMDKVATLFVGQARAVLTGDTSGLNTRFGTSLINGLIVLKDVPGCSDLCEELRGWMTKNKKETCLHDLIDAAEVTSTSGGGVADLDAVQQLMSQLQKVKLNVNSSALIDLKQCHAAMSLLVACMRSYIVEAKPGQGLVICTDLIDRPERL